MATTATAVPTRIPSGNSIPTVLVECGTQSDRYFAQTTLPYSATECVADLIQGQHDRPLRVLLVDVGAKRVQDISEQIAEAIYSKAFNDYLTIEGGCRDFCEHHAGLRPALAA